MGAGQVTVMVPDVNFQVPTNLSTPALVVEVLVEVFVLVLVLSLDPLPQLASVQANVKIAYLLKLLGKDRMHPPVSAVLGLGTAMFADNVTHKRRTCPRNGFNN
jgi:hypothetical protein